MTDLTNNIDNEEFSEFENLKNKGDVDFWWASDLMKLMNYPNMKAFHKVIDKTTKTFVTLNIQYYENIIPFYQYRHIVKPGISGWAQVNHGYTATVDETRVKIEHDFYYIKHFSLWLDILIVFKTIKTMLTGFGAR